MNPDSSEKISLDLISTRITNSLDEKIFNNNSLVSEEDLIEIDGSILEGGGQILRISLALGVLLRKNIKIISIRAGRSNPGLQRQHLASAGALAEITGSKIESLKLNSKELTLKLSDYPIIKENYKCDCNGAGSIGLMIQQITPILIFSSSKSNIEMIGGTVVSHAPSTFYINDVLKPILKRFMNLDLSLDIKRHGAFPRGGGIVNFSVNPIESISPIKLTSRGDLQSVMIRLVSSENFSKYISVESTYKEIFKETKKILSVLEKSNQESLKSEYFGVDQEILIEKEFIPLKYGKNDKSFTLFGQIVLKYQNTTVSVEELYSDKLEKHELKNFSSNLSIKLENLLNNHNECLDEYTVDHIIIFMALAKGKSKIHIGNISTHTLTAIEIIKKFIPFIDINITCDVNESIIEIEGISWKNENMI